MHAHVGHAMEHWNVLDGASMEPAWSQHGASMEPAWSRNGAEGVAVRQSRARRTQSADQQTGAPLSKQDLDTFFFFDS
jgi:hypothetical protein